MWSGRSIETVFLDIDDALEWDLISRGQKSQTTSKPRLLPPESEAPCFVMARHGSSFLPLVVTYYERRELQEFDDEDVKREGMASLATWKRHWCRKSGSGHYSPVELVWTYEFKVWSGISHIDDWEDHDFSEAAATLLEHLYPVDL